MSSSIITVEEARKRALARLGNKKVVSKAAADKPNEALENKTEEELREILLHLEENSVGIDISPRMILIQKINKLRNQPPATNP